MWDAAADTDALAARSLTTLGQPQAPPSGSVTVLAPCVIRLDITAATASVIGIVTARISSVPSAHVHPNCQPRQPQPCRQIDDRRRIGSARAWRVGSTHRRRCRVLRQSVLAGRQLILHPARCRRDDFDRRMPDRVAELLAEMHVPVAASRASTETLGLTAMVVKVPGCPSGRGIFVQRRSPPTDRGAPAGSTGSSRDRACASGSRLRDRRQKRQRRIFRRQYRCLAEHRGGLLDQTADVRGSRRRGVRSPGSRPAPARRARGGLAGSSRRAGSGCGRGPRGPRGPTDR